MAATSAPPEQYVSRVRLLPAPVTEPPFDDELGIVVARGDRRPPDGPPAPGTPIQGTLPLDLEPDLAFEDYLQPLDADGPAVAGSLWLRYPGPEPPPLRSPASGSAAAMRASGAGAEASAGRAAATGGPRRDGAGTDELPDPRRWTARLARSALECLHGRRPLQQLVRWTAEPVYRDLARRAIAQDEAPAERPRIRALRVCRVTPTVAEASVVVQWGGAARAVAVRLEADDGRWLCTAFDLVEPGPPRRASRRRGSSGDRRDAKGQRAAQASSNASA